MIKLTTKAAQKIKSIIKANGNTQVGIRASVKGGGCSGFTYALSLIEKTEKEDKIITSNEVTIAVDAKSFLYLMGTEIDYLDDLNATGFKFVNPNAKRTCGCGESFSV